MAFFRVNWFLILILSTDRRFCEEYMERRTEYGKIRGIVKEVLPGQFVEMFLGVPYASPPVGELRFEYTKTPEPWNSTINTTSLSPACPQHFGSMDYLTFHYPGFDLISEDCLYMNIYVPKADSREDCLPTLLWIHGGSNEVGMGAMLTGEVLAAYGRIIVISFNYRLGNLGFLHVDSKILPGNLGLVDQVEVIKWVHRNIHFFSGDPNTVTLAGHSAGAADVGIHMLNPNTKGLYRHAILMSGSPLSYWAILNQYVAPQYRGHIETYLKHVGCTHEDIDSVKRCLKSKSENEITNTYLKATVNRMLTHPMPVDAVTLLDFPINRLSEGKFAIMPVLMGFTTDEGAMIAEANPFYNWQKYDFKRLQKTLKTYKSIKKFSQRFGEIVAHEYMNYSTPNINERCVQAYIQIVAHEYMNYSTPNINERCVQAYIQIESDTSIKVPTLHFAEWMETYSKKQNTYSKVYLYSFEFQNDIAFPSVFYKAFGHSVVPHGRDLFYVFGIPLIGHPDFSFNDTDARLSKHMMQIWTSFVKTGKPSNAKAGGKDPFPAFTMETKDYIKISNDELDYKIKSERPFNMRAYDFWTRVEWLFYDWTETCDRSNSQFQQLDLILLICLFLPLL